MLKASLCQWIPRIRIRPNIRRRCPLSVTCSPIHGRATNRKAHSLTNAFDATSMSTYERKRPHSDGVIIRKIKQPKRQHNKMDLQTTETKQRPLPTIELTGLESTIKRLLLDLKEYIQQKERSEGREMQEEMVLRFTGGWVRDKLLGVTSHDIDVAISTMTGLQFGTYLQEYLDQGNNLEKYHTNNTEVAFTDEMLKVHTIKANPEKSKHLETATTRLFDLDIDLVNLRKETYTEHSRNPEVEFGTAEEDALRRDATVNALFYNLNTSELEDLTGRGLDDMENKLIRTPLEPYQTFKDDPLRVLRLIRFASRLGYRIDEKTQQAMQDVEIKKAVKVKITKERVGIEVEKTLQGPDPETGLKYIDDLGLYTTIFANQYDDVEPHTTSWSLVYNALDRMLSPVLRTNEIQHIKKVKNILIRNEDETFYAWVMAAFVPWVPVPERESKSEKPKPPITARAAEVARDNLRMESKIVNVLKDATAYYKEVSALKTSVISNEVPGTAAEIRQHVGLQLRRWKKDWRLIVLMAMLQEISSGKEFTQVLQEFDVFLSYVERENLLEVTELRPIANGKEVSAAFGIPHGKWLASALEMLISWQLLHPENHDKAQALEELMTHKAELGIS